MKRKGELFLVATPIGNRDDLSPRAKETIETAEIILAEDTRRFAQLKLKPKGKVIPFYREKEAKVTQEALCYLAQGKRVALLTDAGTPLIADPGSILVKACHDQEIKVTPIPGPSAFLLALISSGFPLKEFAFFGYLPKSKKKIRKILRRVEESGIKTIAFYETPHRIVASLMLMKETWGEKKNICRPGINENTRKNLVD